MPCATLAAMRRGSGPDEQSDPTLPTGAVVGNATASAPGTCGELVQGITGGVHFLVTCPINQFSRVTVTLWESSDAGTGIRVKGDPRLPKTLQAVGSALVEIQKQRRIPDLLAHVSVANPLPIGKGMGSSSADITAAVSATGTAAGVVLSPETIARIALSVEPTDGVMFPGVALFDHRSGRVAEPLGPPPPLEVIVVDCGGEVDTLEFNRIDRTADWESVSVKTDAALELVREGISRGDPELVGRGATISARAGCTSDAVPWVERAESFARENGAVGINVAHSGTVVGILLDARKRHSKPVFRRALQAFADADNVLHFRVIGGGVRN